MSNKKDELDLIPAIAPGKDEQASRRRSLEAPKSSNFNGMLVFSLVLMAVMLGIGGFTLFEVQQRLDQSNELLETTTRAIRDLEDRLAATGTDVSKELQTLKEKQTTNFSEIDKLWKVAYRENRPAIKALEKSLADMNAADKQLQTSLTSLKGEFAKTKAEFTTLSKEMSQVRQNIIDDSSEMTTQVAFVRGQVQDQAVVVEGNKRSISSINKKVTEVEEAIEVFDRYRQQVNQRMIDLQNQISGATQAPVN